ncbi:GHKL domain-containing protein [Bacillus sp. S3]|uniref:sensor histidine kinase n=1 Tax=Bacillus sp. S3 TaxID=486398 RepID=UPI00118C92C0|nr:HAMP domain-containing sensor histidine kinase [Bacillus sp. S3]QCJ41409.1 GHKL domain-containing protein [Bacillus sp. S3]
MATKWKSRLTIALTAFLFTFGLSGILAFFIHGSNFIHRDYFHTPDFQMQLDEFKGYLGSFELYDIPIEEAKKEIKVTKADITEHRYRYGNLQDQISNLKMQYEERIQRSFDDGNKEAADAYTAERDAKIEDITKNFESDEYVEPKVAKEKEKRIEEYYKKREDYRSMYLEYKEAFRYYVKNNATGKLYTNLKDTDEDILNKEFNTKNALYVTNISISRNEAINLGVPGYEEIEESIIPKTIGAYKGQIAVMATPSTSNYITENYRNYQQTQMLLFIYSLAGLLAFIVSLIILKKSQAIPSAVEKWRPYFNKIPIDVRMVFLIIVVIGAFIAIYVVSDQIIYVLENPYFGVEISTALLIGSLISALLFVQWNYFLAEIKDLPSLKKQAEKAIFNKVFKKMRMLLQKSKESLAEAFLKQSTGTQLFILLTIVFGLGLAAIIIAIHPVFILFYLLLLGVIGIPMVIMLVKRIGYFNRIVEKTNELAAGKLGDNLPVTGKSVLAALADNINQLKQGVRTSQNEQAKSERLKTELITNVSHDLRTPLTSIITYTELLKTADVSGDERTAYLEIIDRKSKRLKVLIDDLFEVSKMASGNIELKKEKVDLVQLLQQALAEHDDTINASSLQFRVTKPEKPVYSFVDGQKLWRVFDNLIGNILKYSLAHSRVYITVSTVDGKASITFKNVSKYELNENSEELFERFKRGDTSRHTEGSGLGLAIAQSIVDLHEGRLEISTDGDLFKVQISLMLVE